MKINRIKVKTTASPPVTKTRYRVPVKRFNMHINELRTSKIDVMMIDKICVLFFSLERIFLKYM